MDRIDYDCRPNYKWCVKHDRMWWSMIQMPQCPNDTRWKFWMRCPRHWMGFRLCCRSNTMYWTYRPMSFPLEPRWKIASKWRRINCMLGKSRTGFGWGVGSLHFSPLNKWRRLMRSRRRRFSSLLAELGRRHWTTFYRWRCVKRTAVNKR